MGNATDEPKPLIESAQEVIDEIDRVTRGDAAEVADQEINATWQLLDEQRHEGVRKHDLEGELEDVQARIRDAREVLADGYDDEAIRELGNAAIAEAEIEQELHQLEPPVDPRS